MRSDRQAMQRATGPSIVETFYLRRRFSSLASGIMSEFKSIQPPKELDLFTKHIFYLNSGYFVIYLSMIPNKHPSPWNVIILKKNGFLTAMFTYWRDLIIWSRDKGA